MNTTAPRHLIVDARYSMTCTDGAALLVALGDDGRWRLWDVTGGEWVGPGFATSGECYWDTVRSVEKDEGL